MTKDIQTHFTAECGNCQKRLVPAKGHKRIIDKEGKVHVCKILVCPQCLDEYYRLVKPKEEK